MSLPTGPGEKSSSPLGMWNRRRLVWAGGVALVAWLILLLTLTMLRPDEPTDSADVSSAPRRTTTTTIPEVDVPPNCPALDPATADAIEATLTKGTVLLESNEWVGEGDTSFVAGNVYDAKTDQQKAAAALWLMKDGTAFTLNAEARKVSSAPSGVDQLPRPVRDYGAPTAALACTTHAEHIPR